MKKIFFLISTSIITSALWAQEPADALRFSWTVPGGTARQQAIGGAMGSLGGDISAIFTNPAGLAFYKTGDFVFSPIYQIGKAKSTYLNRTENDSRNKLVWGTTGFVFGSGGENRKVSNVAFALAYNRTADFNSSILYRGVNTQSSYSQKFLEEIGTDKSGNSVSDNYPFGASLAFRTFWIDTVGGGTEGNFSFQSRSKNLLPAGLLQQQTISTRGGIDEFALAGSVDLNDKLLLGATLGVPVLSFHRDNTFVEADPTDNKNNQFDFGSVNENISTKGVGLNLKLGLIYKLKEFWRLGLAFHTPTIYSLTDRNLITVTTNLDNADMLATNEDITSPSAFRYQLITPYRAIASVSYVLREIEDVSKQKGFLTADVEYVNYKASSFKEDQTDGFDQSTFDYLNSLNNAIDNAYKGAFNFRVGGELKFTTFMVRAGGAYYGNPYKNINGEKGSKLNLSGGLGYRNSGFFVDLTYVHSIQKDINFPYRLESAPYFGAHLKSNVGNVLATIGFKF